jgi:D-alanine-D-alanine ligase-like ATP-grasp enzyme
MNSEALLSGFAPGTCGRCLVDALAARQIPYRYLSEREITNPHARLPVVSFAINGERHCFDLSLRGRGGRRVPGAANRGQIAQEFVDDKVQTKAFLRRHGFSVPEGAAFAREDLESAELFFTDLVSTRPRGACLKPRHGRYGKKVYLGIRALPSFRAAWKRVAKQFDHLLLEEMMLGTMYRVFCVGGRAVAAISWRTMNVVGDGRHSIEELIERKNAERKLNPAYADFPLRLGTAELQCLQQAGLQRTHVPARDQVIYLRRPPNEDEATDATDTLHGSYFELVERALALLPQMILCGVDLIVKDASMAAAHDNHCFLELNNPARFVDHHHPWRGQSRDVAGAILDHLAGRPAHERLAERGVDRR